MTAPHIVDPARLLDQALSDASPDLMRHLLSTVVNALCSAEADAVCGAEYGLSSPDRVTQRNGYRHRELDTRAGTIDVAIPKLRTGSYFPDWLLERRKRAESALISVVATCYLLGVSTRRMEKLVDSLGSLDDAVRTAAKLGGVHGKPSTIYPRRRRPTLFDVLTDSGTESRSPIEQILSRRTPRFLFQWPAQ